MTRRTRATSLTHPGYRLTETDRRDVAILTALNLWPKQHIADAYGVSPRTVRDCHARYARSLEEWTTGAPSAGGPNTPTTTRSAAPASTSPPSATGSSAPAACGSSTASDPTLERPTRDSP